MLQAVTRRLIPLAFDIMLEGNKLGEFEIAWDNTARFRIRDTTGQTRRAWPRSSISLHCDGAITAIAKRRGRFTRAYEVDADQHFLQLRVVPFWKSEIALVTFWKSEIAVQENGVQIGRVFPSRFLSYSAFIDLPNSVPLQLQVFIFSHVLELWRQSFWEGLLAGI